MEWVRRLEGHLVGLDTAPLIYFMEAHPLYLPIVEPFFEALDDGRLQVVTSSITLTEVLVQPLRSGALELASRYRDILYRSPGVKVQVVTGAIAETAAALRAQHGLRTPDALQLATALQVGATAFLTNDQRLPPLPQLSVLTLKALHAPVERE